MNKQITAKIESLSDYQLKSILINAIISPDSKSSENKHFDSVLEKYPLESVMSFTSLLVVNKTIDEDSWLSAINYYYYPMDRTELVSYFRLINCGYLPRLKSVVYCILCGIEAENQKKG